MSLKRKSAPAAHHAHQKKAKIDFFAPRTPTTPLATSFSFDDKAPGTTRLVTWNVNGIKSLDEKILKKYLEAEDPSIVILTETKYSRGKPDILCLKTRFKHQFWGTDPRPGNAGTAVLSKIKPLQTTIGLPTWKGSTTETEGRYVELEFENMYVVGTYVPNSGDKLQALAMKQEWNTAFQAHLRNLDARKPVIWAGDFNCIPTKKDLDQTAQGYWNSMGGLSQQERDDFNETLNPSDEKLPKFADAWRHLHPAAEEFTHSSHKFGSWRLDSFIVSERIVDKAVHCEIRHALKDLKLSDHWPVTLDITATLNE